MTGTCTENSRTLSLLSRLQVCYGPWCCDVIWISSLAFRFLFYQSIIKQIYFYCCRFHQTIIWKIENLKWKESEYVSQANAGLLERMTIWIWINLWKLKSILRKLWINTVQCWHITILCIHVPWQWFVFFIGAARGIQRCMHRSEIWNCLLLKMI